MELINKKNWFLRHKGFTWWLGALIAYSIYVILTGSIWPSNIIGAWTLIYWVLCLIKRKIL